MLLAALAFAGCAVPTTHGPYYKPSYPDMLGPDSPWFPSFGAPIKTKIWFMWSMDCKMQLTALPDDNNFLLSWDLMRSVEKAPEACAFAVGTEPIILEDVKTGKRAEPESVHRVYFGPVKPQLDLRAGMKPHSPYFSEIDPGSRTYTASLRLRVDFKEKIPPTISIQLPDLLIGGERFTVPVLKLKREETWSNIKTYMPVSVLPMTNLDSISNFGMLTSHHTTTGSMGMYFGGAALWHEEKGVFRIAASFSGRDDVQNSSMNVPRISGEMLINVLSDKGLDFSAPEAFWITEEGERINDHIDAAKLGVAAYRTKIYDLSYFGKDDWGPDFVVLFPGMRPDKARVTLPSLDVIGVRRPILPIDFEYNPSGIGFLAWP